MYSYFTHSVKFQRIYNICSRLASTKNTIFIENTKWQFETGTLALHSDSSATVSFGDTTVLSTVTSNKLLLENIYSLPFSLDYTENFFNADKKDNSHSYYIRKQFNRDRLILIGRAIDRSLRPLFPYGLNKQVHVVSTLIANDNLHDPEVAAINSSSLALSLSSIPWNGPVAAVRIGLVNDNFVINPDKYLLCQSSANYLISCTTEGVCMIEGCSIELNNNMFLSMLKLAYKTCLPIIETINILVNNNGVEKDDLYVTAHDEIILNSLRKTFSTQIKDVLFDKTLSKPERSFELSKLMDVLSIYLRENYPNHNTIQLMLSKDYLFREIMTQSMLEKNIRPDGRNCDNLRSIKCFTNVFKPLHGSSLFQRGETQILSSVKFSCPNFTFSSNPEYHETESYPSKKLNYSLRYSSPSYATRNSEINKFINRREIGHGMLAENAFYHILPYHFQFNTEVFICFVLIVNHDRIN